MTVDDVDSNLVLYDSGLFGLIVTFLTCEELIRLTSTSRCTRQMLYTPSGRLFIPHIDTINRRFGRSTHGLPNIAWDRVLSWSLYLRKQHHVMFIMEALKMDNCNLSNLRLLRIIGNYTDSADLRVTPVPLLRALEGRCPRLAVLEADIFCRHDVMNELRGFVDGCSQLRQLDVLCYHDSVGPCKNQKFAGEFISLLASGTVVDILPSASSHPSLSRIGLVGCMSHIIGVDTRSILTRALCRPELLTHIILRGMILKGTTDDICAVASLPHRLPNLVHWAVRVNMLCFPLSRIIDEREATPLMLWNLRLAGVVSTCIDCEGIRPDRLRTTSLPWLDFLPYTHLASKAEQGSLKGVDVFRAEFGQFLSDVSFETRKTDVWENTIRPMVTETLKAHLRRRSKMRSDNKRWHFEYHFVRVCCVSWVLCSSSTGS